MKEITLGTDYPLVLWKTSGKYTGVRDVIKVTHSFIHSLIQVVFRKTLDSRPGTGGRH